VLLPLDLLAVLLDFDEPDFGLLEVEVTFLLLELPELLLVFGGVLVGALKA
jgi:hypothetical protein